MRRDIREAFDRVQADGRMKESALRAVRQARRETRRRAPQRMYAAAVMASVLVCVLCLGGYAYMNMPVSYISIDLNPSIELSLNRLNRVVSVQAFNDDGEIVLRDIRAVGRPYMQVIDEILSSEAMHPYFTEDAALTFTVAADSRRSEQRLMQDIDACAACREHRGSCYRVDGTLREEAHLNGLSFGKYRAYCEVLRQGGELTIEQCRSMSMAQIRGMTGCGQADCDGRHGATGQHCREGRRNRDE